VLLEGLSPSRLQTLMGGLVQDASSHSSANVRKLCISTLRMATAEWISDPTMEAKLPGFHTFMLQRVGMEVGSLSTCDQ
jgi:hypothetical protein